MTIIGEINKLFKTLIDCSFDLIEDVAYITSEFSKSIMIIFITPLLLIQIVLEFLYNVERRMK